MKWVVERITTFREEFEVEAEDWSGAFRLANRPDPRVWDSLQDVRYNAESNTFVLTKPDVTAALQGNVLRQQGEPWCTGEWHQDIGVYVVTRAYGYVFTKAEIDLILGRLRVMVTVVDQWNGAGCDSASFKFAKPYNFDEPLFARHVHAPRPDGLQDMTSLDARRFLERSDA